MLKIKFVNFEKTEGGFNIETKEPLYTPLNEIYNEKKARNKFFVNFNSLKANEKKAIMYKMKERLKLERSYKFQYGIFQEKNSSTAVYAESIFIFDFKEEDLKIKTYDEKTKEITNLISYNLAKERNNKFEFSEYSGNLTILFPNYEDEEIKKEFKKFLLEDIKKYPRYRFYKQFKINEKNIEEYFKIICREYFTGAVIPVFVKKIYNVNTLIEKLINKKFNTFLYEICCIETSYYFDDYYKNVKQLSSFEHPFIKKEVFFNAAEKLYELNTFDFLKKSFEKEEYFKNKISFISIGDIKNFDELDLLKEKNITVENIVSNKEIIERVSLKRGENIDFYYFNDIISKEINIEVKKGYSTILTLQPIYKSFFESFLKGRFLTYFMEKEKINNPNDFLKATTIDDLKTTEEAYEKIMKGLDCYEKN